MRCRLSITFFIALCVATILPGAAAGQQPPQIPLVQGLKITFAVHVPDAGPAGIAQGDYEMVVEVSSVRLSHGRSWRDPREHRAWSVARGPERSED